MAKYIVTLLIVLLGFQGFPQADNHFDHSISVASKTCYRIFVQEYSPFIKSCAPVDKVNTVLIPKTEMLKSEDSFFVTYVSHYEYITPTPVHDFLEFFSLEPQFEVLNESFCPPTDTSSTTKTLVVWNTDKARGFFYAEKFSRIQSALVSLEQSINHHSHLTGKERLMISHLNDLLMTIKITYQQDGSVTIGDEYNNNIEEIAQILSRNLQISIIVEMWDHDIESAQKNSHEILSIFVKNGVPVNQIETAFYDSISENDKAYVTFRIVIK